MLLRSPEPANRDSGFRSDFESLFCEIISGICVVPFSGVACSEWRILRLRVQLVNLLLSEAYLFFLVYFIYVIREFEFMMEYVVYLDIVVMMATFCV